MKNYKKYIFTGIMSIIPIALTYFIIEKLFIFFSVPGKRIINLFFNYDSYNYLNIYLINLITYFEYIFGFVLTLSFIYILGLIVSNVLGKRIYQLIEHFLNKIPIVSKIYKTIKSITDTISKPNNQAFQKVVLIEYPRKGLWTLAMVTGESKNANNEDYYNLFVPTTPNPTSGYLIFINKNDVIDTDISVDDGLGIIISGGMIGPEMLMIK